MKILIAIDRSPASSHVLDEVAARAWPANTVMQVLTVLDPIEPYVLSELVEAEQEHGTQLAGQAAERLRAGGLHAEALVLRGDPKTVILQHAESWPAELILVGAQGVGALERFLLGGVSRAVLQHASCSVEVVRKPVPEGVQNYKILLPVDGSTGSERAAKAIAELSWRKGTEVRILSAAELRLGFFRSAFEIPALDSSHLTPQKEQAMSRAQNAIGMARTILEPTGLLISESISILLEPPKQIIVDEAATWKANLIVLGSHGLRGMQRFLLGSTSEAVAMHASCSVFVVR